MKILLKLSNLSLQFQSLQLSITCFPQIIKPLIRTRSKLQKNLSFFLFSLHFVKQRKQRINNSSNNYVPSERFLWNKPCVHPWEHEWTHWSDSAYYPRTLHSHQISPIYIKKSNLEQIQILGSEFQLGFSWTPSAWLAPKQGKHHNYNNYSCKQGKISLKQKTENLM